MVKRARFQHRQRTRLVELSTLEYPFQFAARFYGPIAPLIDGRYPIPAAVRVD